MDAMTLPMVPPLSGVASTDPTDSLNSSPQPLKARDPRYLAVRNLDEYRSPNVGTRSSGWKQALQAFTTYFEGRIPTP